MSNPIVYTASGTYDAVAGQQIILLGFLGTEVFVLNLPQVDPNALGREIEVLCLLQPGASISLQPDTGDSIVTNVGLFTSPSNPLTIIATSAGLNVSFRMQSISAGIAGTGWYGQCPQPTSLIGMPNDGSDTPPVPVLITASAGRSTAASSNNGRHANPILIVGAKGGNYLGAVNGESGGSGTNLGSTAGAGGDSDVTATDGDGGSGGTNALFGGPGGDVLNAGPGNGGPGGFVGGEGGRGGDVTGGGTGGGGISAVGGWVTGRGGDTNGVGNGGDSGGAAYGTGRGGNSSGGGNGGNSGDWTVDTGAPGTGVAPGVSGSIRFGATNAPEVSIGRESSGRNPLLRAAMFESTNPISGAGPHDLNEAMPNLIEVPAAGTTTYRLPDTNLVPLHGTAVRLLFTDIGAAGLATIDVASGSSDTIVGPAITGATFVVGTALVYRCYGTNWFLESRAN